MRESPPSPKRSWKLALYPLIRRALLLLPPENVHAWTLAALRTAHRCNLLAEHVDFNPSSQQVMGLNFPNRVGLAAGFDKNGDCIDALGSLGFGFLEIGTVTPGAQPGNAKPRLFRVPRSAALVNRMGFPNAGATYVQARLARRGYRGICGVNIAKNAATAIDRAIDDYVAAFRTLAPHADYVVANVSSPNTASLRLLQDVRRLRPILEALLQERLAMYERCGRRIPLLVKVAPDLSDQQLEELALLLHELAIDGVVATNTTLQRPPGTDANHLEGGLSGAPLHRLSLMTIRALRDLMGPSFTIIGVGGISCAADAHAAVQAGADLVQLYTGLIYRGPKLIREVIAATADHEDPA